MTPKDMAALHARCFIAPRPWSEQSFAAFATDPHVRIFTAPGALLVGRSLLDEAELLTLATAPDQRRQGLGARLVTAFHDWARAQGAERALLEVAADNTAARTLYAALGYGEIGKRPAYYRRPDGQRITALLLSHPLLPKD